MLKSLMYVAMVCIPLMLDFEIFLEVIPKFCISFKVNIAVI